MTNTYFPPKKFICCACGHIYDEALGEPDNGLPAGTRFEDVLDDWQCSLCGVKKSNFEPYEDPQNTPTTAFNHAGRGVVIVGAGLAGLCV